MKSAANTMAQNIQIIRSDSSDLSLATELSEKRHVNLVSRQHGYGHDGDRKAFPDEPCHGGRPHTFLRTSPEREKAHVVIDQQISATEPPTSQMRAFVGYPRPPRRTE